MIRPVLSEINELEEKLESISKLKLSSLKICFVPQESVLSKAVLTEKKLDDLFSCKVEFIGLPIYLHTDNSAASCISMYNPCFLSELSLHAEDSENKIVAQAILNLEHCFGRFKNILAKGNRSKQIIDIILNHEKKTNKACNVDILQELDLEQEFDFKFNESNLNFQKRNFTETKSGFDQLLLFDREVDLVTPMLATSLNYECQLYENFLVKNNQLKLPKVETSVGLNNEIFEKLRDEPIFEIMESLNKEAVSLKSKKESVASSENMSDLKDFVKDIPSYQIRMKHLAEHIGIAETLLAKTFCGEFKSLWQIEQNILNQVQSDVKERVLELIWLQYPWQLIVRLLVLKSFVDNGLSKSFLQNIEHEMVNAYGTELLYTLRNLKAANLLSESSGVSNWSAVKAAFDLSPRNSLSEAVSQATVDVSYILSGRVPIIIRLLQLLMKPGWQNSLKILKVKVIYFFYYRS